MIIEYLSKGSDRSVSLHFPESAYYYAFLKLDHSLVSAKEERVFGNSYDFRNFLVQHSVRFESDCIHPSLYQRRKMIVVLIVDLLQNFRAEFKSYGHASILPKLLFPVS